MINGMIYNIRKITAAGFAHVVRVMGLGGFVTKGCALSYSGNMISITPGYFIPPYGHLVKMDGTTQVEVEGVTADYYAYLVYEIDLSKTNTVSNFQQGAFKIVKNSANWPTLTQQNLEDVADGVYQMPFARFRIGTSGISNWTDLRVVMNGVQIVEVPVSAWVASGNGFIATISVSNMTDRVPRHFGVHHTTNETDATRKNINKNAALISTVNSGAGALTFYATQKPAIALSFEVEG